MKLACAALLVTTACSHSGMDVGAPDAPAGDALADAAGPAAQPTIFTIVLENHDYAEIVGASHAPYLNGLIAQGALFTHYRDTNHPSLPNYLHMISGDDQYPGYVDVSPTQWPYFPSDKPNLGTQLEAAHIPWRSYQESMGSPCKLATDGDYAPKHDPFLYFTDQQSGPGGLCAQTNVDYGQFAADLAANTYRYMWITPNLVDDGHNPTDQPVAGLATCDSWLSHEVPKILASAGYQAGGVLFITWDEAEGRNHDDGDQIPMIVLSPRVKTPGMKAATAADHGSYLASVEDLLGLARLDTVKTAGTLLGVLQP